MENNIIHVKDLEKSYGEKKVLHGISFDIHEGQIVGLLGENGAGKTTILKCIAGLQPFDAGNIYYYNQSLKDDMSIPRNFGILIESAFLDYLTANDNLKLLLWADGETNPEVILEKIKEALALVELLDVKDKKVKYFSYGMKQRLGLAQALMTAKTFLMLDEPFLGLDPIGKDIVKNAIVSKAKEHNMAVLFSSHGLEDVADICDTVVMIKQGRCTFNGPIQRSRLYTIQIDSIPDEFVSEASKMGVEFLSDNILKFQPSKADKYSIDDLLKLIYTCNMHIVDIWAEELSLKNLFIERDV